MSNRLKFVIALGVGGVMFIFLLQMVGVERLIEAIVIFLSPKGLYLLILSICSALMSVIKWQRILRVVSGQKQFKDLNKLWFAGFTLNYFTPIAVVGGEPFRIYGAKKLYGISWAKSTASVFIERLLDWTVFLIATVLGIFAFLLYGHILSIKIIFFIVLIIGILVGLLVFFYSKTLRKESIFIWFLKLFGVKEEKIKNSTNGNFVFEAEKEIINFFSEKKKVYFEGLGITFFKYLFYFLRVWALFYFLTGEINFLKAFAIFGFNNLALLVPVPAALGSLEATGILSFKNLGFNIGAGAVYAMVSRSADLIIAMVGGIFLIKLSLGVTTEKILKILENFKENNEK